MFIGNKKLHNSFDSRDLSMYPSTLKQLENKDFNKIIMIIYKEYFLLETIN